MFSNCVFIFVHVGGEEISWYDAEHIFCVYRSRVGDWNPLPVLSPLESFRSRTSGDYRQVGDVLLLKFFVVEEGGGQGSKRCPWQ